MNDCRVAVCSRSFSNHPVLRRELLDRFPQAKFNETGKTLSGLDLIQFLKGSERAIVAMETIEGKTLDALPELKVISKYGVGLDKLDLQALDSRQIKLGWTPGVNAQAVAELTLALALNIVRNVYKSHELVKGGEWRQIGGRQLSSMTFGILGCGHVGKSVVRLLQPFGCKILVHDIKNFPEFYKEYNVTSVGFVELLQTSDILSLHIPKNQSTEGLLNKNNLNKLKKESYLINTARGGLVDEFALLELLQSGHVQAAALDVFSEEPPGVTSLIQHHNLFVTSHIGGSSEEAVLAMGRAAINGLLEYRTAGEYEQ